MYRHWNLDLFVSAVLLVFCFFAGEATALSDVTGIVKDDAGKPIRGAFVSAATASGVNIRVTVFTNAAGRYRIADVKPNAYVVSAYGWGWETKEVSKNISGNAEVNFTLAPKWDPDMMMSTAEWMSFFPWDIEAANITDCTILCHNTSYSLREGKYRGAKAKDIEEGWRTKMDRWSGDWPPTGSDPARKAMAQNVIKEQTAIIEKYWGPNAPLPRRDQVKHIEPSDAALRATFWEVTPRTKTLYTHGADADANGNIWFVMFEKFANKVARFDPRTNELQELSVPTPDAGPHTMLAGRGGSVNTSPGLIFVAQMYSGSLGVIDPKTNQYTEYKPMTPGILHGVAIDSAGNPWITHGSGPIGAQLVKFDIKTKKLIEYAVPGPAPRPPDADSNFYWQLRDKRYPDTEDSPEWGGHSNCVDSQDKVWMATAGNVVRFDPVTLETKFFPIPGAYTMKGLSCTPDGNVWANGNQSQNIVKLNSRTGEMKFFPTPTPHGAPYGSVLDPRRGKVWVADAAARSMIRIDLKTEQMTEYPIPTWNAAPSFIGLDPQGRVVFGEKSGGKVAFLDPGDL